MDIFDRYECIFVDFDNTIYLWSYDSDNVRMAADEWIADIIKGKCPYRPEGINTLLARYLKRLKETHPTVRIYLLTQSVNSIEGRLKYEFLAKNLPGIFDDGFSCGNAEDKIILLRAFEKTGVDKKHIVLIDDKVDLLKTVHAEGFIAITPQLIMEKISR